jgi:Rho GTPase-activating protein 12/27
MVRSVVEVHSENTNILLSATSMTTTQLSQHVRDSVSTISPEKDTSAVASQAARSLALATPRPTLYFNYHVGECRDLIFGVSLVDYATSRGLAEGEIPRVVKLSIEEIEKRGLDSEGIYRVHDLC